MGSRIDPNNQSGFSLIEIAAALLIIGVSISYLMAVNNQAIEAAGDAINERHARLYAQATMARVLAGLDPKTGDTTTATSSTGNTGSTRIISSAEQWEFQKPGFSGEVTEPEELSVPIDIENETEEIIHRVTIKVFFPVFSVRGENTAGDSDHSMGEPMGKIELEAYTDP